MLISRLLLAASLVAGVALDASGGARGEELRIAFSGAISSADPMFHNIGPNNDLASHIFDRLIESDENLELRPGLALSWTQLSDMVWEFKLRPGVKFHDGTPLTPEDIAFSIERAANVPNSPASFETYTRAVKSVVGVDPTTIRIETHDPRPLLPLDMAWVHIQSKSAAEGRTTEEFNSGIATIGTGPYKFVEWVHGSHATLARNDAYWGERPAWETVTIVPITNSSARVAALLSGDVDVIGQVPPIDVPNLRENSEVTVNSGPSWRIFYLQIDHRDVAPYAFDNDGNVLGRNPIRDLRVRRAISMAIDRRLLVDRIMEGLAIPAGQILADGFYGSSPNLNQIEAYDLDGARALLAEAGYPDGFRLTLHTSNDRYLNAEKMAQGIAQMLTRVGITTDIELAPHSVFRSRGRNLELSFQFGGWGSEDAWSMPRALLHTYDEERGFGVANRGRYSNPEFDRLVEASLGSFDEEERLDLIQEATELAIDDLAIIPLYWPVASWGMREGLTYTSNPQERTLAMFVRPE